MWGKRRRSKRRTETLINLITVVELLHRFLIREGPRPVVELVGILAEHFDGGNVVSRSVGFAPHRDGLFNRAPSFLQHGEVRRLAEGIPEAHGDA
jgi:hypothetical protein